MKRKIFIAFAILMLQVVCLRAQNDFYIKNAHTALCFKGDFYKLGYTEDFECKDEINSAQWYYKDAFGQWQGFATGSTVFISPNVILSGNKSIREIEVRVSVACYINGEDQIFYEFHNITLVDNDYFNLQNNNPVNCSSSNISLSLLDLTGVLSTGFLEDIEWIVPSDWNISSGQGTANVNIVTNGNISGTRSVKVKFKTVMIKPSPPGPVIRKSCGDKSERTVIFSVNSCRPIIDYTSNPNYPKSHSSESTKFDGLIQLGNDDYNYVSGGSVTLLPTFEFNATSSSSLNLFIEDCSCESPWHDPSLMGDVIVTFPDAVSFSILNNDESYSGISFSKRKIIQKTINIFPNPTSDILYISGLIVNDERRINLRVLNAQASLLFNRDVEFSSENIISINLHNLPNGVYIIQFYNNGQLHSKKITKI
jgi:hypothetical protein